MIDPSLFPASVQTILITRLDGLGDIVLGTMLLSGLHARWPDAQIKLLVRPGMESTAAILPTWVRIIGLPFDPRQAVAPQNEKALADAIQSVAGHCQADLTILGEYNRVWAGEIIASLSGARLVIGFDGPPGLNVTNRGVRNLLKLSEANDWQIIHVESQSREPDKYAALLEQVGIEGWTFAPSLAIQAEDRAAALAHWSQLGLDRQKTIIVFPGSNDGSARTLLPSVWNQWMAHLAESHPILLLGGEQDTAVISTIAGEGLAGGIKQLLVPMQQTGVTAALIESAAAYVGKDTGPMHVSGALGKPTLGIYGGGHCAERFLPTGRKSAAIRMPIGCYGCDWFCPFDTRLCLSHMPVEKLLEAGELFLERYLHGQENADAFSPHLYELPAPSQLPHVLLGPTMRQHRQFLEFNHRNIEHQNYVAHILDEMTHHNRARDEAISHVNRVLSEMSRHNSSRDMAIAHLGKLLAK